MTELSYFTRVFPVARPLLWYQSQDHLSGSGQMLRSHLKNGCFWGIGASQTHFFFSIASEEIYLKTNLNQSIVY